MKRISGKAFPILVPAGVVCLLFLLYWLLKDGGWAVLKDAVSVETDPALFILLFLLLPLVGFPISVFLVLLGLKFGAWPGVVIMTIGMGVHILISYFVARSFLRGQLMRLVAWMGLRLPEVPRERMAWFSFIFMVIPGLSYSMKNYTLPLAGVPFRIFFLTAYLVQAVMGIPFVIAGDAAAGKDLLLLGAVLILLLAAYLGIRALRKRSKAFRRAARAAEAMKEPPFEEP